MESLQSKKSRRHLRPALVVGAVAFVVTCGVIACGRSLQRYSLRESLEPNTPVLDLNVAFYNLDGTPYGGSGGADASAQKKEGEEESSTGCPAVSGGDLRRTSLPDSPRYAENKKPPCPLKATWNVHRHPVAVSIFARKGEALLEWYESNQSFAGFRDSALWRGLTEAIAVVLKVRGADLALPTLPLADWSGQFLRPLLKEVLKADAALHYDLIHGAGGFVLSFDKAKTSLVAQALPILVKHLGASAYSVTSPKPVVEGMENGDDGAIVQLRLQGKKIFITERGSRVYLGTALEGLLNVIADPRVLIPPAADSIPSATAIVVVRGESFFDKLLPVAVGVNEVPITIGLALSGTETSLVEAQVPGGKYSAVMDTAPFPGVVGAVPRDSLGALVTSIKLPLGVPVSEWSFETASQVATGGMALVWDITGEDQIFHYGIAVVAPSSTESTPTPEGKNTITPVVEEERLPIGAFLSDAAVSTACAGGSVWLGASSDLLLSRMQEACNKSSLSLLDIKGIDAHKTFSQQVSLLINSKIAVRELYRLGGGAKFSSDAEREAEVVAQRKLLSETDAVAASLPILGVSGGTVEKAHGLLLRGFAAPRGGV